MLQHALPYIVKSAWHPVWFWSGVRTGDIDLVVLVLIEQTVDLSLPTSGDRSHCGVVVE